MLDLISWTCSLAVRPSHPAARTQSQWYPHTMIIRLLAMLPLVLLFTICVLAESAGGLRWMRPEGWTTEAPRPMRAATYTVPPTAGDQPGAECVVYFFGENQGGSVEANIERWKGQFRGAAGKPPAAKVAKRTSRGIPITTIDVSGEYTGMGGPMARERTAVPGYRLLGAVVEGPRGNVFVKFTGPAKTVAANQQKFEQLLASVQPEAGGQ